ncbi:MAG: prepilin-type N-terminal cleavage/methylation domain-containing protein [Fimbriimonas sp.]|nr:prepilin-type N-terminal cleavage/methylation domain-containing protein [Fimbriimonas sp.]
MKTTLPGHRTHRHTRAFTLVEVLVVVLILLVLTYVALPAYITEVYIARQGSANANARQLASVVQAKAITIGSYDTTLTDYTTDMGGAIPNNPCTATTTGFGITISGNQCRVAASTGSSCGTWTPITYVLGYSGE